MTRIFTEKKAEEFLKKYVPVAKNVLAKDFVVVTKFVKSYPVILKIISPQALHKSDIGGVIIVNTSIDLKKSYDKLISISKKKKIKLEGILVQEFIKGEELIIGLKKDPTFNHVILLGIGGIFVELLKDISFRVCPITTSDAESMINDLKAKKLLEGFRGSKAINRTLLKKTLVAISKIPEKNKKILEMDINPFVINDKIGKVVDARIIFE